MILFRRQSRSLVAAFMLALGATVFAGQSDGRIEGVVVDPAGALIPRAKIIVSSRTNSYELQTTEIGEFNLALPAGAYQITVECPGFKLAKIRNVRVKAGLTQSIKVAAKLLKQGKCTKGQLCL
jgi:hypothetical protein